MHRTGWAEHTPFADPHARPRTDSDWRVHRLPTRHDAVCEAPEAVAAVRLDSGIAEPPH